VVVVDVRTRSVALRALRKLQQDGGGHCRASLVALSACLAHRSLFQRLWVLSRRLKLVAAFLRLQGVEQRVMAPYNPRASGAAEDCETLVVTSVHWEPEKTMQTAMTVRNNNIVVRGLCMIELMMR
jgi:hypothetical protein